MYIEDERILTLPHPYVEIKTYLNVDNDVWMYFLHLKWFIWNNKVVNGHIHISRQKRWYFGVECNLKE